jgi:hypothetical protein
MGRELSPQVPSDSTVPASSSNSFVCFTVSSPFALNLLQSYLHNRNSPNPLQSISYTLVSSRRRVYPLHPSAPHFSHLARKSSNFPSSIPIPFNNLQNAQPANLFLSYRSILMGGTPLFSFAPTQSVCGAPRHWRRVPGRGNLSNTPRQEFSAPPLHFSYNPPERGKLAPA